MYAFVLHAHFTYTLPWHFAKFPGDINCKGAEKTKFVFSTFVPNSLKCKLQSIYYLFSTVQQNKGLAPVILDDEEKVNTDILWNPRTTATKSKRTGEDVPKWKFKIILLFLTLKLGI